MLRFATLFALSACFAVGASVPASNADDKKTDTKAPDAKVAKVATRATVNERALSINFTEALGLHFDSLTTLGIRIEEARKSRDPVALANAARYLATAEAVSEKKAKLTADDLTKEAVEMAKVRKKATELKAVALILKDSELAKELPALAKKAEKREADRLTASKAGERARISANGLSVNNNTDWTVHIWVEWDGGGTSADCAPHSTADLSIFTNDESAQAHAHARSQDGGRFWDADVGGGSWDLNP
jgi:hypothetical protein